MRRFTALFYLSPWILAGAGAFTASCAQGVTPDDWAGGGTSAGGGSQGGGGGDGAGGTGTGLTGPCSAGEVTDCYTGPAGTENIGVCEGGTAECVDGHWGDCEGETHPGIEICNGEDDDCNAIADDGNPNGGDPCNTGEPGPCAEGTLMCEEGMVQCIADVTPQQEECNDVDDDCNGEVDDGNPGGGAYCSTGAYGICAAGTMTCQNGGLECIQNMQAATEICDLQDNDCDGSTDEGNLCSSGYSCISGSCQWICPYVYAHDGTGFQYETSVGGAGIKFGAPGEPARQVRRRERRVAQAFQPMWARLDRARVGSEPVRGSVRAKLLAAEDEIVYLRRARLAVVEHPEGCEVLSETSADWRILKQPQRRGVLALDRDALRPPRRATWRGRVDVTAEIGEQTDRAVRFDRRKPNYYELDFGPVRDASQAKLVIDGWKFREVRELPLYYRVTQPRLEVQQADGSWREVMRVPTPRGDRKAVVVDLANLAWPTGRYRMRLWTGTHQGGQAMWYLDRVRLTERAPAEVAVRYQEASAAVLDYCGPPTMHCQGDPSRPRLNTDDGGGLPTPFHETIGTLTRHGDVSALVGADDDRLVVMERGDGVELTFDPLRPPGPGRQQTLFLDTELVYRSRVRVGRDQLDAHRPARIEPLPYAARANGAEPDAIAHERYLRAYQTRAPRQVEEPSLRETG